MPGGMMGGMGGMMGGMGGMMGGMGGMMGGMGRKPQTAAAPQENNPASNAEYDVDRWRMQNDTSKTTVQKVREDWESGEKKTLKEKLLQKKETRKAKKEAAKKTGKKEDAAHAERYDRENYDRNHTVKMKDSIQEEPGNAADQAGEPYGFEKEATNLSAAVGFREESILDSGGFLGMRFPAEIDSFLTENPMNSAILSGDSLSLGVLSLNQVPKAGFASSFTRMPEETGAKTPYMAQHHEMRENRKYDVKIL